MKALKILLVIFILFMGTTGFAISDILDTWYWRGGLYDLKKVAYGNGVFVAVSQWYGDVLTSNDGSTWAVTSRIGSDGASAMTFGNGVFVVHTGDNKILTSPDGVTWTQKASGISATSDIIYITGMFVAVGTNGRILTSSDCVTWTQRTSGITDWLTGVTYANGILVAVGRNGRILTSLDCVTWTQRTSGITDNLTGVTYGNGMFVAVGYNGSKVLTSSNGENWVLRDSGLPSYVYLNGITYGNGTFVAVGQNGTILTSTDCITWTARSSGTPNVLNRVEYLNGIFVTIGYFGTILSSSDGLTWTHKIVSAPFLKEITYGNETFVAVGENFTIVSSSGGVTWVTRRYAGCGAFCYYNDAAYGNKTFVVVGDSGYIQTSVDGISWTTRPWWFADGSGGGSLNLYGVGFVSNKFIAVGAHGVILTSSNGIKWTERVSGTSNPLAGVTHGNGIFVVVGVNGTILTSTDGITWTQRTSGTSDSLQGIAYGNETFVAISFNGTILTSTDGITWTQRTSGTSTLLGITYSDEIFVIVGGDGAILTSIDGSTWTQKNPGISNSLYGVTYGNGTFVVVGSDGIILQSAKSPCTYTVSPLSYSFGSSGVTDTVTVTASLSNCGWTATSDVSWMTIISGNSGTGDGTVTYSLSANTTGSPRTGTVSIAGQTLTVKQAKSDFSDVTNPSYWAYGYIYGIYTEGITTGCGSANYCPNMEVTRGQMAAFIIRALYGEDFTYTTTPYFSDVPSTHTFFKYVQKLKDDGITAVSGTYDVDNYLTRGQMAAFIIRAKYGEDFSYTTTPYYSDVPSTHNFFKYVQKMKDDGITAVSGTYNVDSIVTREQMAAFLARAFLGME